MGPKIVIDRKHLLITWRRGGPRPDGRRWRLRHNRYVANVYWQVGRLEVVAWYA